MWSALTDASLFNASPAMKVLHALFVATLQGTLLLGVACGVTFLMRRASAAQRHLVWLLALSGLLVLPLVGAAIPHQVVIFSHQRAPEMESSHVESATFASPISANSAAASPSTATESASTTGIAALSLQDVLAQLQDAWPLGVLGFWLAGVFVFAIRLWLGLRHIRRLGRESMLVQDGLWLDQTDEAAQQLQLQRPVTLRIARAETSAVVPLTWGWRRPAVLLPNHAETWLPQKRRAVLLHEMAHIARGDWPALWIAHLVCALYWFHPLVWFAARALQSESERAADDRVLAVGLRASDYAECLMEFMNLLTATRQKSLTLSIGMAQSSTIGKRLLALLDATRSRQRLTRRQLLTGVAAVALLLLSIATIGVADEKAPTSPSTLAKPAVTVKGRILDTAGQPVSAARVFVYAGGMDNPMPLQTTQSDAGGIYEVQMPDNPNTYRTLQIEKEGFGVQVGMIGAGDAKSSKDWTLAPPTSLSGVITDENAVPIANARVTLVSLTKNRYYVGPVRGLETRTDVRGRWTLDRLPVGATGEFQTVAPHFARQWFNVLLEAHTAPFPAVKLQPGFDATGRVLDMDGNPVAGAQVSLSSGRFISTLTAEDGTFTLSGLTLRDQDIAVTSGIRDQFAPLGLRVSPTRPKVQIKLEKGVTIRGRLLDADTKAPIEGVSVGDQWRTSADADTSNALGQFEIMLPGRDSGSLTFQKSSYQFRYIFLSADQMAQHDAGDIQLKRGTIWSGKVRVNGAAPGEQVVLNLKSAVGNAQLASDKDGNFQINALPPGTYTWTSDLWDWKPISPRQILIPEPQNTPFVLDVNVQPIPRLSARGRVVNEKGEPVAYALVALQGVPNTRGDNNTYTTISRADGSWERIGLPANTSIAIQRVEYGDFTLRNPVAPGRKVGSQWQFPAVVLKAQINQARIRVVDSQGRIATGARVLAMWNQNLKLALTDAQGSTVFQLAPQKVRFLAAKGLEYGEVTLTGSPLQATIHLQAPRNPLPQAEATVQALIGSVDNIPNAELIGDQRWRTMALKADKATTNWNRAGENFGRYLDNLVYMNPAEAVRQAPVWLGHITTPETMRPFFLRLATANCALLAAKSKDATAKAWANRWLDRQIAVFNVRLILNAQWSGGDLVSRYLQGYAVAKHLGRPEANRFFEKALQVLPKGQTNPGSYSYPDYFELADPHATRFRDAMVPEDQVNFQGALGSAAIRENPANATQARAALEALLQKSAIASVSLETKGFARRRIESEILGAQIKSLRTRTSTETPASAFKKLQAFDTTNYFLGGFALSLTRRALERGDRVLARKVLDFAVAKGWDQEDNQDDWAKLKVRLLPAPTASQIETWRVEAISDLKNGDPMHGGTVPDRGTDAKQLRAVDPALGRIILEAKWTRLGPLAKNHTLDNRYEAITLATAMGEYDPLRAFSWFARIPRGGDFDPLSDALTLAVKIVGVSAQRNPRPAQKPAAQS